MGRIKVNDPSMDYDISSNFKTYTSYVPKTVNYNNPIFRAMLVDRTGEVLENELDGHMQGYQGTVRYSIVNLHDPSYDETNWKNIFGISYTDIPYNIPAQGDKFGRVNVTFSDPDMLDASGLRTLATAYCGIGANGGACLVNLWDTVKNEEYVVQEDDIGKTVYVSRTATQNSVTVTGKAGYATISHSDEIDKTKIGIIISIPQVGANKAWIHFTGAEWTTDTPVE